MAGGLYSGYVFYSTIKSLVSTIPLVDAARSARRQRRAPPRPGPLSDLPGIGLSETSPVWSGQERVNVLLLGVDQREDEKDQPTRSDTMIVLTLDPVSKSARHAVASRATCGLPSRSPRSARIASTRRTSYGDVYNYPGGGPALAKKTVSLNFGIPIHYYARVDFQGL